MKTQHVVSSLFSVTLLPIGLVLVGAALRGHYWTALGIYLLGLAMQLLVETARRPWNEPDTVLGAAPLAARRVFLLLSLAALHALGSCPSWFLGLLLAATLMQWGGFFLVRPSRLAPPLLPELAPWNTLCQSVLIGVYLCDFALTAAYPANFRFSETFHLAGYSFLASLMVLHLAHDFFRMRRPLLYWLRSIAYEG